MPQSNGYKTATWILAIIVVILLAVLWSKSNETVSGTFDDINQRLSDCRVELINWNEAHPNGPANATEQAELDVITDGCLDAVKASQDDLSDEGDEIVEEQAAMQ